MTNIYLYSPEENRANIRLRDPTTVVPRYGVPVISGGAPPGRTVYYQSLSFVPFNTFQINTQTIDKWQSPLSVAVPVAKALPGNSFVPFDTAQTNTQTVEKWQSPLSIAVPVAKAQQGNAFVPFDTFQINTQRIDKWLVPLSKPIPVAQAQQGNSFVPFNTLQTNTATVDKWLVALSRSVPPVAQAQQGSSFVPFNTAQLSINFTPFGWHQSLSVAAPVARTVPVWSFVPFDTTQPQDIEGMAWWMPLGVVPLSVVYLPQQYIVEPPQFGEIATSPTVHVTVGDIGRHTPGRYRERTTYNVDKQRFETLLIEIRDDEAVPSKAKTAIAAVKKAKAIVLELVAYREIGTDQALELARLLENARAASKAMAAIENARLAMAYAQKLMDEQDDEEESMILLSMS